MKIKINNIKRPRSLRIDKPRPAAPPGWYKRLRRLAGKGTLPRLR